VLPLQAMPSPAVPIPFLLGILMQECGLRHFSEPRAGNEDTYIVVGLDTNNAADKTILTSRGYGAGQDPLFHHPPRPEEVTDCMLDVTKNVRRPSASCATSSITLSWARLAGRRRTIASLKSGVARCGWVGPAPDDSPLLVRDAGTQDIYALDWEAP
jgi:hypothetical protein